MLCTISRVKCLKNYTTPHKLCNILFNQFLGGGFGGVIKSLQLFPKV